MQTLLHLSWYLVMIFSPLYFLYILRSPEKMHMWLCIVICGAVAHHHVTMMFCLFGCPLPPFFLLSPHFIQFSPSISLHYPILHLAQGRKKTTDGTGTASSKANIKTGQFPSSPTDPVALDTGTAERVLPPEIVRRIEY